MSNGFDKKKSSIAFSLQRTYERLLNYKISWSIVGLLAVAVSIFLLAGGIYDLVIQPVMAYYSSGTIISFYPYGITDQFMLESIIVMIFYALGFAGLLVSYRSTKYASTPNKAYRYLLVGVALVIISYVLLETNLM